MVEFIKQIIFGEIEKLFDKLSPDEQKEFFLQYNITQKFKNIIKLVDDNCIALPGNVDCDGNYLINQYYLCAIVITHIDKINASTIKFIKDFYNNVNESYINSMQIKKTLDTIKMPFVFHYVITTDKTLEYICKFNDAGINIELVKIEDSNNVDNNKENSFRNALLKVQG